MILRPAVSGIGIPAGTKPMTSKESTRQKRGKCPMIVHRASLENSTQSIPVTLAETPPGIGRLCRLLSEILKCGPLIDMIQRR